jgi:hypothetical protein
MPVDKTDAELIEWTTGVLVAIFGAAVVPAVSAEKDTNA